MENGGKRTGTTTAGNTNRIQEVEGRISCVEDTIEEMYASIKENVQSKIKTALIRKVSFTEVLQRVSGWCEETTKV